MVVLPWLITLIFILGFAAGQPHFSPWKPLRSPGQLGRLAPEEEKSLRAIASTLGKKGWDFGVDPCGGSSDWITPGRDNAVRCRCDKTNNDNTSVCHVVSIVLKTQALTGSIPPELSQLPFLQEIDLSWNGLYGSIPRQWGSMNLVTISLPGNRITGSIPAELGNITTLINLVLEDNNLSGSIPPQLGNLPLEKLVLTSNSLSGEIPSSLASLSTLKEFRISDNNFTGQIPNFIQSWIDIETLVIHGSGLKGPIPSGIASLTKLIDLRISDLSGNGSSTLPDLSKTTRLKNIILRSCNIIGSLPTYIGDMKNLETLDLSFNKLTGPIPESFNHLSNVEHIYFTGNSLTGRVPQWMLREGKNIDLSYNNFTTEDSDVNCQQHDRTNLFASSKGNSSGIVSCLRNSRCDTYNNSLHINCGGRRLSDDDGNQYEADEEKPGASSYFYLSKKKWGFSSTGHFMDYYPTSDSSYIRSTNLAVDGPNAQLYTRARLSPLSLTYYAYCLMNGSYTVKLHFTKIMVTDDSALGTLGRRIFDVYIQGKPVLKDFKIEYELKSGGVNEAITRNFTATVHDNTLDIRFYWAGKGTTNIPFRGAYGPLISAISVDPNSFSTPPPPPHAKGRLVGVGEIAGIIIAFICTVCLLVAVLWWKCLLRGKDTTLRGVNIKSFTLRQIKAATNNFDLANKIGEGGFGSVYKGRLPDGTVVAVKQLSSKSKQGNREFVNEIGLISSVQHPHLVKLYGCSVEDNELLLVYEYMENNSLARALFGTEEQQLHLDWPTRHRICIGIAQGLAYLHGESPIKIIHRDIKATNVLLDKNLVPKISDFGLAKLHDEDNTHISTRVAGTFGYMAPEYALRGYLTDKADVYSFGVVLLEIVSGRSNLVIKSNSDRLCLLDRVDSLKKKGKLLDLADPRLESNFDRNEVMTVIKVALLCTNTVPMGRPTMSAVVSMLEGGTDYKDFVPESTLTPHEEI